MRPVVTNILIGSGSQGIGRPAFVTTQTIGLPHEEQALTYASSSNGRLPGPAGPSGVPTSGPRGVP
jgi:hypothetical protein